MGVPNILIKGEHRGAVSLLTQEEKGDLLDAIISYHLEDKEVPLEGQSHLAFQFMKPFFDENKEKYKRLLEKNRNNGKKGGRPKGSKNKAKEIPRDLLEVDGRDIPQEWDSLREIWNRYDELPKYKQGLLSLKDPTVYINALKEYTFSEMEGAIKNYVSLLSCQTFPYQSFPGFIEKGLSRFYEGAKPFKYQNKQESKVSPPEKVSATRPYLEVIPEEERATPEWIEEHGGIKKILLSKKSE